MTLYEYTCYDLTGYRNTGREVRAKDTHDLLTFRRARGTGELVKSPLRKRTCKRNKQIQYTLMV